jgi:hypothetical protein
LIVIPETLFVAFSHRGIIGRRESYENGWLIVNIHVPRNCPEWIDIDYANSETNDYLWPIGMAFGSVELGLLCNSNEELFTWYRDDIDKFIDHYSSSINDALVKMFMAKEIQRLRVPHEDPWPWVESGFK